MDYLDTRDLEEKRNDLKEQIFNAFIEEFPQYEEITESYEDIKQDKEEITSFIDLWNTEIEEIEEINEIENDCSEFYYGETLINENYFEEYVKDLLTDCGYISKDFPHWVEIDWNSTAENVQQDYSQCDYQGETFYFRS
ncbi:hypothetical protein [Polaribacter sp.]|uniref:hypothetical protein n=1 Tax=Polaribacter sp. TaxID=1920175 RepID=UPI003F6B3721